MRLEEIEEPLCMEGQIKIKPAFTGLCGRYVLETILSFQVGLLVSSSMSNSLLGNNILQVNAFNCPISCEATRQMSMPQLTLHCSNYFYTIKWYDNFFAPAQFIFFIPILMLPTERILHQLMELSRFSVIIFLIP